MPNRRHSSRRFTPSCSNNITNSCRCDMIDCSDHGTPAPPPQANNADTMRQPCPRTPVHYLSRPYTLRERGSDAFSSKLLSRVGEGGPRAKRLVGEGSAAFQRRRALSLSLAAEGGSALC